MGRASQGYLASRAWNPEGGKSQSAEVAQRLFLDTGDGDRVYRGTVRRQVGMDRVRLCDFCGLADTR